LTFDGAVLREQGVTFAIAVVRHGVLAHRAQREESLGQFHAFFGGIPVVLMEQDAAGVPSWFGRPDLTRFLANVQVGAIPWRRYTV
jgi:hypothetical protein